MLAPDRQAALDKARGGDRAALGQLLQSFLPYVRAIVRSFRTEKVNARLGESDLIQESLFAAYRSFEGFRGSSVVEFAVWLRTIAQRTAAGVVRNEVTVDKRNPDREVPPDALGQPPADPDSSPSDRAIDNEQQARLMEAVTQLPPDMQKVLLGRHLDGLSHAELGRLLGRSEGAVRVLYVRALGRLRDLLRGIVEG